MSYVDDVCYSLVRVLEHACVQKAIRLAGIAGNLDFWVEEIRDCLDCIRGYEKRHRSLVTARERYAARHSVALEPAHVTRSTTDDELRKLERRLTSAAHRFFKLCCADGHLDELRKKEIEAYLGIRINYSFEPT